jgi:hypothetical protein
MLATRGRERFAIVAEVGGKRKQPAACLRETLVREYVARTLTGAAAEDVAGHLRACDDCRDRVRLLERDQEGTVDPRPTAERIGAALDDTHALFSAMRIDRGALKGQLVAGKYRVGGGCHLCSARDDVADERPSVGR